MQQSLDSLTSYINVLADHYESMFALAQTSVILAIITLIVAAVACFFAYQSHIKSLTATLQVDALHMRLDDLIEETHKLTKEQTEMQKELDKVADYAHTHQAPMFEESSSGLSELDDLALDSFEGIDSFQDKPKDKGGMN